MALYNLFRLATLCSAAIFSLIGCADRRTEIYVYLNQSCESNLDCTEVAGSNTVSQCLEGACQYVTMTTLPSCTSDAECDDDDTASADTCDANGCTHVIREIVEIVRPIGTNITATFDTEPRLTIVDENVWQSLGEITITANDVTSNRQILGIVFTALYVGSMKEFTLAQNGQPINSRVSIATAPGNHWSNVVFGFDDLILTGDETVTYQVWGRVSESFFFANRNWDPEFRLYLDGLHMNGVAEDVIVSQESGIFSTHFRMSKPTVVRQALSTNTLTNSYQDLYKVQVAADANGLVEVISLSFKLDGRSSNGLLSNFRVRVGSTDLLFSEYSIHDETGGGDYENGALPINGVHSLVVHFTEPRYIVGSGSLFTMSAYVSGSAPGDYLTVATHPGFSASYSSSTIISGYADDTGRLVVGNGARVSGIVWNDGFHNFTYPQGDWAFGSYDIDSIGDVTSLWR